MTLHTPKHNIKLCFQTFVRLLSPLDQFFPNSKSCRCFSRIVYRGSTYAKYITLSRIGGPFFCFFCLCCLSLPLSTSIFKFWPMAIHFMCRPINVDLASTVDQSRGAVISKPHKCLLMKNRKIRKSVLHFSNRNYVTIMTSSSLLRNNIMIPLWCLVNLSIFAFINTYANRP